MKNNRIVLFCITTSLFWFSLYTYVPTLSIYSKSLGANYKMVGLIIGSYGFTQMLLRIPLGIFSDKLSRRKVFITLGLLASLISSLGLWYFSSVNMVLISRAMAGVSAASWVAFTILFSSYFKSSEAPKAIGFISAFNSAGQMAGIFLGGLASQALGQRSPFIMGAVAALLGIVLSLWLVENRDVKREPIKIRGLLSVAGEFNFLLICILAIFSQFVTFATVYGFTPVAAEKIGASDFQLGLLTSLSTLPVIFAAAASGSLFGKYLGEKRTIVLGFVIGTAACIVIPFIQDIWVLYITQIIGGFGRGLVFPLLMGLSIKSVDSTKRATAMGFFQAIYSVGMFLGPAVVGYLNDSVGLSWGFWATGSIGIMGAAIAAGFVKVKSNQ